MSDAADSGASKRPLTAAERLTWIAAAVVLGSLFLPWYGIPLSGGLAVSGFVLSASPRQRC